MRALCNTHLHACMPIHVHTCTHTYTCTTNEHLLPPAFIHAPSALCGQTTYTGVYAKGGPTNVDMDPTSLASVCDRSAADARGVKVSSAGSSRRATSELIGAAGDDA